MIVCCYAVIENQWTETEFSGRIQLLPDNLQKDALRKKQWIDRQFSIAGKLLVGEAFKQLRNELRSLSGLQYNTHHRPYFEGGSDFNIAHSGNIVICCATDMGKIGADIEEIKPIDLDEYTDHFTENEWNIIRNSPDPIIGFYNFWTRKEAVLKATGTGFHTPLNTVDVSEDMIIYNNVTWHLQKISINEKYLCHVASTVSQPVTSLQVNY